MKITMIITIMTLLLAFPMIRAILSKASSQALRSVQIYRLMRRQQLPIVEKNARAPEELDATAKPAPDLPDTAKKPVSLGNPWYQDVHSLAGTVPESLGVGFVGDGTAGAGGMGAGVKRKTSSTLMPGIFPL